MGLYLFCSVILSLWMFFSDKPRLNQGRELVDRKQVKVVIITNLEQKQKSA